MLKQPLCTEELDSRFEVSIFKLAGAESWLLNTDVDDVPDFSGSGSNIKSIVKSVSSSITTSFSNIISRKKINDLYVCGSNLGIENFPSESVSATS